jgi:hypothetical protein
MSATTWQEPARAKLWSATVASTLTKRAAESRLYTMDFSQMPEIVAGDTISSVTAVTGTVESGYNASSLTVGTTGVAGSSKTATAVLSGGTDGAIYKVSFKVATTAGYTLIGVGYLCIDDE